MHRTLTTCLFATCLVTAGPVAAAQVRAAGFEPVVVPDRKGRDTLYAWLSAIGYPDGVGAETVVLRSRANELAFVVGSSDEGLELFSVDGTAVTITRADADGTPERAAVVVRTTFETAVRARLHTLEREVDPGRVGNWGYADVLPERTRLVLLARRAHREGLDDVLEDRLLAAAAVRSGVIEWPRARSGKPLPDLVHRDVELFERVATWESAALIDDLAARRARLLRFARLFPESEFAGTARDEAATLMAMAETAADIPTEAALAALTGDALARGLVLRLREQTADMWADGVAIAHHFGAGTTPLDRLIALGDAALPALLRAYGDATLTRVVSTGRDGGRPRTSTVGDVAIAGVQAITGQWFRTADEARAWLARRENEGEAVLLAEQVFRDTWIDFVAARRLAATDAAAAGRTLAALLDREMTIALRVQLIAALGGAEDDSVTDVLRSECAVERPFAVRQIAAQKLRPRDPQAARRIVLELWSTDAGPIAIDYPAAQAVVVEHQDRESAWNRLIPDLVATEAWGPIAMELPQKTPWTRVHVLRQIAASAPAPLAERAVAEMLLDGLLDESELPDAAGTGDLGNCPDPRVCDVIGAALAGRDDAVATLRSFPALAAREDRDVALATARAALRSALGQEPRPTPPPFRVTPLADADVAALALACRTAELAAQDRAEDAIAAAGLPALSPLRRTFGALASGVSGRRAFARALSRLATTVGRVIVRPGVDEHVAAAVLPLADRPLDVRALVASLRALLDDGRALTLLVHRPADGTGVTIVVAAPAASQRYRLEMNGAHSRSSHRNLDEAAWDRVAEELHAAVTTPHDEGWAVRIRLR